MWYASQPYTARCIAVTDGDTIKVLKDRKTIRIRLYGIDAPEKVQAFGQQAKNALSAAAFGKNVKVFPKGTDRYGRTLAWIFVGDKCVNRDLVASGMDGTTPSILPANGISRPCKARPRRRRPDYGA